MGLEVAPPSIETSKPRKFAILLAGHASEYIRNTYGGVPVLIRNLLGDVGETWDTYRVVDGEFPSGDNLYKYEGFVVTGSCEDAHGSKPWVLRLCEVIQQAHKINRKLLGICFGHQVISRALGGKTGRAAHGWELGLKTIALADAMHLKSFAHQLPSCLGILEVHQDEVLELPPDGEVLASSEQTCIEIFAIGNQVLGVQGHPEFTEDITLDILDGYAKQHGIREEVISRARVTLQEGKADSDLLKQMCKSFMKATPSSQMQTLNYSVIDIEANMQQEKACKRYGLDSKLKLGDGEGNRRRQEFLCRM